VSLPHTTGALAAELRDRLFRGPADRRLIGAELELIPLDARTRQPLPLAGGTASSLAIVRAAGVSQGWRECLTAKGSIAFDTGDGGWITFEPGGQIEYGSPPLASASALLERLTAVAEALRSAALPVEAELATVGMHPHTPLARVPMQLQAPRYERMAQYFATIGEHGGRMMRQSASFQVSVDLGAAPERRWRVLNAAAPCLTAIFANSSRYEGTVNGHRSMRAHAWRRLDPTRTGIFAGTDPACDYLSFALQAPMMMRADEEYPRCADVLRAGRLTRDDFETHLSTLFPDVRPRGYLEVRSIDALPVEWLAAPLALVGGIAYDDCALDDAAALLGEPDESLLVRAGREGLADPTLSSLANELAEIALAGCERLGEGFLRAADRARARDYFAAYTSRGRSPADDPATA
jgi:glutamate--cysteine ligase